MRALSIKQPWASLIAHGIKDIENRTWKTNFRGRIYIHACGKPIKRDLVYDILDEKRWDEVFNGTINNGFNSDNLCYSAIIGEVDIIDCVINYESIWAEKSDWQEVGWTQKQIYNWVLANPVLYDKPILNVKGKLSFWEPDIDIVECIGCSGKFDAEFMAEDRAGEKYCNECEKTLFPVMRKEYLEMLERGEIKPEDN